MDGQLTLALTTSSRSRHVPSDPSPSRYSRVDLPSQRARHTLATFRYDPRDNVNPCHTCRSSKKKATLIPCPVAPCRTFINQKLGMLYAKKQSNPRFKVVMTASSLVKACLLKTNPKTSDPHSQKVTVKLTLASQRSYPTAGNRQGLKHTKICSPSCLLWSVLRITATTWLDVRDAHLLGSAVVVHSLCHP